MAPETPAATKDAVLCPVCGASLPAGSRFCPKDGPLPDATGAVEKYCPQCPGRPFNPDDRFCNLHGPLSTRAVTLR
jgi:predicted nucleic acid-binding Zn ribbon protein